MTLFFLAVGTIAGLRTGAADASWCCRWRRSRSRPAAAYFLWHKDTSAYLRGAWAAPSRGAAPSGLALGPTRSHCSEGDLSVGGCTFLSFEQVFERRRGGATAMRRLRRPRSRCARTASYDDPCRLGARAVPTEGPEQFLWRGRLWKVRAVLAHWVETGPWWQSHERPRGARHRGGPAGPRRAAAAALGTCSPSVAVAGRGRPRARLPDGEPDGGGVFDLAFDWADGRWTLVGCTD